MATLKELETSADGTTEELTAVLEQLQFNERGLIPAIAQDSDSGEVLMMAWMDQHAIQRSLDEGFAVYFSRSRQQYWRKGDTSGHVQELVSMSFDCDGDAVLLRVRQTGSACHTNRRTCFYLNVREQQVVVDSAQ
ncbi:MAG: phosphoribosyl-AMP cyclohydrolase [Gammaproteobacteria bacterium TMED30]|jgi:phosphoribosyl-AMP cyclohydrolase|nr:phosphoribosyl-AMP cyclohydrolase [Gammaproteobacteria bacterium]OUU00466.1 MAG: phosphoribosyl-AMP cyclohydrolase [Gammaproteobacteria bacterium TMED30]|tara:strand:+ start:210 stop:614 length:405 start_codon:yes stop_codon:yes gene_type:complete